MFTANPGASTKKRQADEDLSSPETKRACSEQVLAAACGVQADAKRVLAERAAIEKNLRYGRLALECEYLAGYKTLLTCIAMLTTFKAVIDNPASSAETIELYTRRIAETTLQATNLKADLEKLVEKINSFYQPIVIASKRTLNAQEVFWWTTIFRADLHLDAGAEKTVFDAYAAGLPRLPAIHQEGKEEKQETSVIEVPKLLSIDEAMTSVNNQLEMIGFNIESLDVQAAALFASVKNLVAEKDWESLKEQIDAAILSSANTYVVVDTLDDLPPPSETAETRPNSPVFLEQLSTPSQAGIFRLDPADRLEQAIIGNLSLTS